MAGAPDLAAHLNTQLMPSLEPSIVVIAQLQITRDNVVMEHLGAARDGPVLDEDLILHAKDEAVLVVAQDTSAPFGRDDVVRVDSVLAVSVRPHVLEDRGAFGGISVLEELLEVVHPKALPEARVGLVAAEGAEPLATHVPAGADEVAIGAVILAVRAPIAVELKAVRVWKKGM